MSLKTIKFSVGVIALFAIVLFGINKMNELHDTKKQLDDAENNIAELEQQDIRNKRDSKALSEEMIELEEEYLQSTKNEKDREKEVEEIESELEEKDSEIEKLEKDLQAKRNREAEEEAEVEAEKQKVVDEESKVNVKVAKTEESKPSETTPKENSVKPASSNSSSTGGQTFQVTHYSAYDGTQTGVTRGGTNMANGNIHTSDGYRVIAVDPNTIPFGSIVEVTTSYGASFTAKADDTGGAINGNIIDIAVSSPDEARRLGRTTATVRVIR